MKILNMHIPFKYIFGLFIVTFFMVSKSVGQSINVTGYSAINNFSQSVQADVPETNYSVNSGTLLLGLNTGETFVNYSEDFELSVTVNVTIAGESTEYVLTIRNNSGITHAAAVSTIDIRNDIETPISIEVVGIESTPAVASLPSELTNYINNNLNLDITFDIDYAIDVRDGTVPVALSMANIPVASGAAVSPESSFSSGGRSQRFIFTSQAEFPFYEIQILRLYNTYPDYNTNSYGLKTDVDWSQSLNYVFENNELVGKTYNADGTVTVEIPLVVSEGSGFYTWRVRPLGTFYEGGYANSANWGEWPSSTYNSGQTVELDAMSVVSSANCFYIVDDDKDKNWSYSRVFTEGNRQHQQIIYADGLNNVRQTQILMDNNKIVSQNIMDYSGRPSVATLPIPVQDETGTGHKLDGYIEEFALNANNEVYTAKDFDENLNIKNPQKMEGGVNSYYNTTNPDLVDDAGGYPFTRTLYTNDGTGRVKEQAAPGAVHMLGNGISGNADGKTIKTYYSRASLDELTSIFGKEAPDNSKVYKVTTVDANGTISISYMGEGGKIIASCLSTSVDNLQSVDPGGHNIFEYTADPNQLSENSSVSSLKFSLAQQTPVTFNYNVPTNSANFGVCGGGSSSSDFLYEFDIKVYLLPNLTTPEFSFDETFSFPHEQTLEPGNYVVVKELNVSRTEFDNAIQEFEGNDEYSQAIASVLANMLLSVYNPSDVSLLKEKRREYNSDYNSCLSYNLTEEEFQSKYNLPATYSPIAVRDAGLDQTINIVEDADGAIQMLYIQGCCGSIEIPLAGLDITAERCPTEDEIDAGGITETDYYFFEEEIDLSIAELNAAAGSDLYSWNDIMGVYDKDQHHFATMIYKMVTQKYIYDDGSDSETELVPEYQYSCPELFGVLQSAIKTYDDLLNSTQGQEGDNTTSGQNSERDQQEEQEDQFDNEVETGSLLLDWLAGRAISRRMVESDQTPADIDQQLPEYFLNLAGYKFSYIVLRDPDNTSNFVKVDGNVWSSTSQSVIEGELNNLGITNYFGSLYSSASDIGLHHIYNPIYAFRVFEYTLGECIMCETSNCFAGPSLETYEARHGSVTGTTRDEKISHVRSYDLCEDNYCFGVDVSNWDDLDKYLFYNCIWVSQEEGNTCSEIEPIVPEEVLPCESDGGYTYTITNDEGVEETIDLRDKRIEQFTMCEAACNSRRSEFVTLLYDKLQENCIIDHGCPLDNVTGMITTEEIYALADKLVEECKTNCVPEVEHDAFPYCTEINTVCYVYDYSSFITTHSISNYQNRENSIEVSFDSNNPYPLLNILYDTEKRKIEVVRLWEAEIEVPNQCNDYTPVSSEVLSQWVGELPRDVDVGQDAYIKQIHEQ